MQNRSLLPVAYPYNSNNPSSSTSSSSCYPLVPMSSFVSSRSLGPNAQLSEDVTQLSRLNSKLERLVAKIGTLSDNHEFRDRLHQEQQTATALTKQIMITIQQNSSTTNTTSTIPSRIVSQFNNEFQRFREIQSSIDSKQVNALKQAAVHDHIQDKHTQQTLQSLDEVQSTPLLHSQQQQQQIQLSSDEMVFIEYDSQEIQRRAKEIKQVERDVMEVASMYRDLQQLVNEQQESIDIIDNNIVNTRVRTEQGNEQLIEADEYARIARKRKLCLCAIFWTFIIVLILILVYATK